MLTPILAQCSPREGSSPCSVQVHALFKSTFCSSPLLLTKGLVKSMRCSSSRQRQVNDLFKSVPHSRAFVSQVHALSKSTLTSSPRVVQVQAFYNFVVCPPLLMVILHWILRLNLFPMFCWSLVPDRSRTEYQTGPDRTGPDWTRPDLSIWGRDMVASSSYHRVIIFSPHDHITISSYDHIIVSSYQDRFRP